MCSTNCKNSLLAAELWKEDDGRESALQATVQTSPMMSKTERLQGQRLSSTCRTETPTGALAEMTSRNSIAPHSCI